MQRQIALLPGSFGELSALTHLNLSWNHLEALPDSFARLTRLVDVDPARPEVPLVAADVQPKRGFRRCCRGGEQHREKPMPRHATGMMLSR